MSDFKIDESSGFIFKNNYKTEDKHPMYKGSINWKSELIDIALWVKTKDGKSYFSVKLSEPYKKESINEESQKPIGNQDGLPF